MKHYEILELPVIPLFQGKFNETKFDTFEEAEAEADKIATENPLVGTIIYECEGENITPIKEICKVRFEAPQKPKKKGGKRK